MYSSFIRMYQELNKTSRENAGQMNARSTQVVELVQHSYRLWLNLMTDSVGDTNQYLRALSACRTPQDAADIQRIWFDTVSRRAFGNLQSFIELTGVLVGGLSTTNPLPIPPQCMPPAPPAPTVPVVSPAPPPAGIAAPQPPPVATATPDESAAVPPEPKPIPPLTATDAAPPADAPATPQAIAATQPDTGAATVTPVAESLLEMTSLNIHPLAVATADATRVDVTPLDVVPLDVMPLDVMPLDTTSPRVELQKLDAGAADGSKTGDNTGEAPEAREAAPEAREAKGTKDRGRTSRPAKRGKRSTTTGVAPRA